MSILERSWLTRGYELDQDGLIGPRTLLSYMEHLRWESLADDSRLQLGRLYDAGYHFVVVAQRLQVEQEPGLGVALWAELSVGRVGNSSIEFGHQFRQGSARGSEVARGSVTAVLLDADGRPTPIPDWMRREATDLATGGWIEPELEPPDVAPAGAWRRAIEVRPSDLDLLRHVNHANYMAYVDDTRRLCAAAGGYGEPAPGGRVRQATIEYRRQALQGERLTALTWVVERDPPTLAFLLQSAREESSTRGRGASLESGPSVREDTICRAAVRLGEAVPPQVFVLAGTTDRPRSGSPAIIGGLDDGDPGARDGDQGSDA